MHFRNSVLSAKSSPMLLTSIDLYVIWANSDSSLATSGTSVFIPSFIMIGLDHSSALFFSTRSITIRLLLSLSYIETPLHLIPKKLSVTCATLWYLSSCVAILSFMVLLVILYPLSFSFILTFSFSTLFSSFLLVPLAHKSYYPTITYQASKIPIAYYGHLLSYPSICHLQINRVVLIISLTNSSKIF